MKGDAKRIGGSNRVLSMREAAEYLHVAYGTLSRRYRQWGIAHHRIGGKVVSGRMKGGRVYFRERNLEAWLERTRETP